MHAILFGFVSLLLACALAPRGNPPAEPGDVYAVLLANARFDCASVGDPVALESLMADDFVHLGGGVSFGRATYQPGWKWSVHNAPSAGTPLCHAPHTGVVLSGHGVVGYEDGHH